MDTSNNYYIAQDNSHLKTKVKNMFERGDMQFNKGNSLETKEEGLNIILQGKTFWKIVLGMKVLQQWIDRENDPAMKINLTNTYKSRKGGNGGGGGGGGGGDDENDKFKKALSEAIVSEKPNGAKGCLHDAVIFPIKFPEIFEGARKPWKGILLYGPPGTGKTFLAKACATEAAGTFFSISSSDLVSKYVGESEKLIRALFNLAREKKPSIIFIDEIDSMCGSRSDNENEASRRIKTEFLVQMQGGVGKDDKGVLVLGATNLPWALDPAIRRRVYIPLPDDEARHFMIKHHLKETPNILKEGEIQNITDKTKGFSGSDIAILVRDAAYEPVRKMQSTGYFQEVVENGKRKYFPVGDNMKDSPNVKKMTINEIKSNELALPPICFNDFVLSFGRNKPSVSFDQLKPYEEFTEKFGQDG